MRRLSRGTGRDWLPPDHLVHFILEAVEQRSEGSPTGITVDAAVSKDSHPRSLEQILRPKEPDRLPEGASAGERMRHRLQTQVGQELYTLRKPTVEPRLGIIKEVMGFRRFRLRGRPKVSLEWVLVCWSDNLKRRFVLQHQTVTG